MQGFIHVRWLAGFLPSTVWIPVPYPTEPAGEVHLRESGGNSKTPDCWIQTWCTIPASPENRKKTSFLSYVPDIRSSTRDSEDDIFMELIMNDFSYFDCYNGKSKHPPSPHPQSVHRNLGILGSSGTSCTKPSVRAARTETWRHATPIRPFFHPPFWTVFPCQVTAGMIPPPKQQVFEENTAGLITLPKKQSLQVNQS